MAILGVDSFDKKAFFCEVFVVVDKDVHVNSGPGMMRGEVQIEHHRFLSMQLLGQMCACVLSYNNICIHMHTAM